MTGEDTAAPGPRELGERVIYALLRPAARLALAFGVSIKDVGDWLQMAYFHEARARGLKLRHIADILDVSPRKAALLSKQLKHNFLDVEVEVALPRRVEFLLWAGPLSAARITQALQGDSAAIERALKKLVADGRVKVEPGATPRYAVVRGEFRLVDEAGWLSRIDGLDTLLGSVANTTFSRFFGGAAQKAASFARTAGLRVRKADLPTLQKLYQETLWPALVALDEAAKGDDEATSIEVSLVWAPLGALADVGPKPPSE